MGRLFAGTPFDIPPQCDFCDQLQSECTCSAKEKEARAEAELRESKRLPPEKQRAKVRTEKRKGKRTVTLVTGLADEANDLPELLARLQTRCGTGGSVDRKRSEILIQGDHRPAVIEALQELGFEAG
ncbi:MAG: translation initiation factor [Planctomycetota bacterium]